MSAELRQASQDSDIQEIGVDDDTGFDERADKFIEDYRQTRRSRIPTPGSNAVRSARSSSPISSGASIPLESHSLHSLLEKQFAIAQQVLAAQHSQALKFVSHFCSQAGGNSAGYSNALLPSTPGGTQRPTSQHKYQQFIQPMPAQVQPQQVSQQVMSSDPPQQMFNSNNQNSGYVAPGTSESARAKVGSNQPSNRPSSKEPSNRVTFFTSEHGHAAMVVQPDGHAPEMDISGSAKLDGNSPREEQPAAPPPKRRNSEYHKHKEKRASLILDQGPQLDAPKRSGSRGTRRQKTTSTFDGTDNHSKAVCLAKAAKEASKEDGEGSKGPKSVFCDAADMKKKVKEAIMKPEYNVANFYKTTGIWQMIARHNVFDNLTLGVIALNALWISIDTDLNTSATLIDAHPVFQIGENLFCVYFFGELFIRFMAFKRKRDGLRDAWFVFDSALVIMMVIETWMLNLVFLLMGGGGGGGLGNASILRLVRLLRLTRMARMVRLLRAMPELMILVKGISVATRSVFFTLCLLTIIIYIFAIAFTQLATDTPLEDGVFSSVPKSMSSLLLKGTLPDLADFVDTVDEESTMMAIFLLFFILLSSLTVMNMLVGVLCEVVSVVSSVEKEQMTVQFVKTKLLEMLEESGIDRDGNRCINKTEFESLLLMPEGAKIIAEVGVDVVGLVDFADHIFADGVELSFPDFMELVLQLRDNNVATVRDVVNLRKVLMTVCGDMADDVIERTTSCVLEKMQGTMVDLFAVVKSLKERLPQQQQQQPAPHLQIGWVPEQAPMNSAPSPVPPRSAGGQNQWTAPSRSRPQSMGQDRPFSAKERLQADRNRPASGKIRAVSPHRPETLPAFPPTMWLTEYEDTPTLNT